jgi:hypothetical protein
MDEWQVRTVYEPAKWLDEHRSGWQFGESGYLAALAERLGVNQAVEIGAGDGGQDLPLTLLPLYQKGIPTVLFERDELRQKALRQVYPLADVRGRWTWMEQFKIESVPCLVVDVDGNDLPIARSAIPAYKPAIVCIEHLDLCCRGHESTYEPAPWTYGMQIVDGGFIIQAPMLAINRVFEEEGFDLELIAFSRVNSIYVRRDLLPALEG